MKVEQIGSKTEPSRKSSKSSNSNVTLYGEEHESCLKLHIYYRYFKYEVS